jgi:hypothetical protein
MTVTKVENHLEETLALPIDDIVIDKPRVIAVLSAVAVQIQALEAANYALITERSIETGVGAQLDLLGRVLGEPRRGALDEPYRSRLRVRVLVNRSNGCIPEMLKILRLFEGWTGTGNAHLRDAGVMTLEFIQYAPLVSEIEEMRILLNRIRGAGVRLDYILAPEPVADMLVLGHSADAPETNEAQGLGWSGDMATGGKLAHAETIS